MPHAFPNEVSALWRGKVPASHEMRWMRTRVVQGQEMRQGWGNELPHRFLRLTLQDIDAERDGTQRRYRIDASIGRLGQVDQRSEGIFRDFRVDDRVSLFGHELANFEGITTPRFYHHHELDIRAPALSPRFLDGNIVPTPELKIESQNPLVMAGVKLMFWFLGTKDISGPLVPGKDLGPVYHEVSVRTHQLIRQGAFPDYPCLNPRGT